MALIIGTLWDNLNPKTAAVTAGLTVTAALVKAFCWKGRKISRTLMYDWEPREADKTKLVMRMTNYIGFEVFNTGRY